MASDEQLAKLDISENLLQMNFMRRTLLAKTKLEKPSKKCDFPALGNFEYPLPDYVKAMLASRLGHISKCPVVKHVPGINGTPFPGFRAKYGGFKDQTESKPAVESSESKSEEVVVDLTDDVITNVRLEGKKKASKRKRPVSSSKNVHNQQKSSGKRSKVPTKRQKRGSL